MSEIQECSNGPNLLKFLQDSYLGRPLLITLELVADGEDNIQVMKLAAVPSSIVYSLSTLLALGESQLGFDVSVVEDVALHLGELRNNRYYNTHTHTERGCWYHMCDNI